MFCRLPLFFDRAHRVLHGFAGVVFFVWMSSFGVELRFCTGGERNTVQCEETQMHDGTVT